MRYTLRLISQRFVFLLISGEEIFWQKTRAIWQCVQNAYSRQANGPNHRSRKRPKDLDERKFPGGVSMAEEHSDVVGRRESDASGGEGAHHQEEGHLKSLHLRRFERLRCFDARNYQKIYQQMVFTEKRNGLQGVPESSIRAVLSGPTWVWNEQRRTRSSAGCVWNIHVKPLQHSNTNPRSRVR